MHVNGVCLGSCKGMNQRICQGGRGKEAHMSSLFVRHHMPLVSTSHLNICPIHVICLF